MSWNMLYGELETYRVRNKELRSVESEETEEKNERRKEK